MFKSCKKAPKLYKVLKYRQIIQILHQNLRKLLKSGPEIFINNAKLCFMHDKTVQEQVYITGHLSQIVYLG